MFNPRRPASAFTLIELLVVVAIITLLIAILLPPLGTARKRSRTVVCSSIMSQWGKGIMAYATSNDGALPAKGNEGTTVQPVGTWADPTLWFNAIPSQLNSAGLSYNDLQLASKPLNPNGSDLPVNASNSLFVCPEAIGAQGSQLTDSDADPPDQTNGPYFIQYGLTNTGGLQSRNSFICFGWNSKLSSGSITPKLTQIPSPDTITLMEKRMRVDEIGPADPDNPSPTIPPPTTTPTPSSNSKPPGPASPPATIPAATSSSSTATPNSPPTTTSPPPPSNPPAPKAATGTAPPTGSGTRPPPPSSPRQKPKRNKLQIPAHTWARTNTTFHNPPEKSRKPSTRLPPTTCAIPASPRAHNQGAATCSQGPHGQNSPNLTSANPPIDHPPNPYNSYRR